MDIDSRYAHAAFIAEQYERFEEFARDGMAFLGFPLTEIQADIADFMQDGPRLRMVMAQRGEAKSTLAALYAVWRIVQRPSTRVLIVSGGEAQASEVAMLVIRVIMNWDILEYLRPDKLAGDKTSVDAFDVHFSLKGIDKSPSVACVGITANLQGKRADLLIPDDVETTKNGLTQVQRGQLLHLTKDFSSICTHGDILYLGTPQTKDSIYNTLSNRGFTVRIWPGRYPNDEELERYGDKLAPLIKERLLANPFLRKGYGIDGTRGAVTDPGRYDESALCEKELDQGPEGFQLQYMLDTSLLDALRQQLKLSDFIVANFEWDNIPEILAYRADQSLAVPLGADFPDKTARMYYSPALQCEYTKVQHVLMTIDPAGGGADEIGYAIGGSVGPYIHAFEVGGIKGGIEVAGPHIVELVKHYGVSAIKVESNMGHGLFELNLRSILEKEGLTNVGVFGEYSTGQKEKRIIDSIVSSLQRHRIVLHKAVFSADAKWCKQHGLDKRDTYSLFQQISSITTDKGSLMHDDRIEALAMLVRHFKGVLVQDEEKAALARREEEARNFLDDPMGYGAKYRKPKATGVKADIKRRRGM